MHYPVINANACLLRADEAAARAAATKLPNVRAQQLTAEKAWREMAVQMAEVQENRDALIAAKAPPRE